MGVLKTGEDAIADYTAAIKIYAEYDTAYYNRGSEKFKLKDYTGAISDYTQATKINPNYINAYINLAVTQYIIGNYQNAATNFKIALEYQTKLIGNIDNSINTISDRYATIDISKLPIKGYNSSIEYLLYNNYTKTLYELNEYSLAIEICNTALKVYPFDSELYFYRALLHKELNDSIGYKSDLDISTRLGGNNINH